MEPWFIIAMIGFVIIIYAGIFGKKDSNALKNQLIADMEDTFEHFSMEIDEENQRIVEHIMGIKQQYETHNAKLLSRIEYLEKHFINNTMNYNSSLEKAVSLSSTNEQVQAPSTTEQKSEIQPQLSFEQDIKERYQDVFHLHDQGKSIDYISRKLDINKGEVQLIVQLARQEDQSGV